MTEISPSKAFDKERNTADVFPIHIESTDTDFMGRLAWGFLGTQLLQMAGKHAENRGWGMRRLNDDHCTWVLSRLCIEMPEMPVWTEDICVRTWVEKVVKFFNFRNFDIKKKDGTLCGYVRSVWSIIDTNTRKPLNIEQLYGGDFLHVIAPENKYDCPIAGWEPCRLTQPELVRTLPTYYCDMDVNGHVNSIRYIEHILDLFPVERYRTQRVQRLEIAYKAESRFGDTLSFYVQALSADDYEVEIRKNGQDTVCQAKLHFTNL